MHLQHLLVQERFVGKSACQAVALQLAGDVVRLRSQLQETQGQLGLEQLERQAQQQLPAAPVAAQQLQQQQQQQQEGGEAPACRSVDECLGECRASVLQALEEHRGENEAVLQLLDSRLSTISAWYEDSSWADGIQQQLAAIEQAFAAGLQQQAAAAAAELDLQAQHAACEELRQWNELLMTAMRQAGGSV
ncbi:hypothetical protein OEZ85_006662 [Tetradesmus obliquus]|uniref:Uncharacterized protein n=1 Tax=Tetradesmus obliquus TaxID=3088 RepID=A0ABY8TXT2_TETOB|nr:hypothetical protein OEZ85_006662 [Tetradesmus obliquus]